jgi:(p)ppGpp synthase/HD superfamily hydrolase
LPRSIGCSIERALVVGATTVVNAESSRVFNGVKKPLVTIQMILFEKGKMTHSMIQHFRMCLEALLVLIIVQFCNTYDTSSGFSKSGSHLEAFAWSPLMRETSPQRFVANPAVLRKVKGSNKLTELRFSSECVQNPSVPSRMVSKASSKLHSKRRKNDINESSHNATAPVITPNTLTMDPVLWKTQFVGIGKKMLRSMMVDPPSLQEYLSGTAPLQRVHEEKVASIWSKVRRKGSLKRLHATHGHRLVEALKLSYIALWGQCSCRSLEVSIETAAGIATVLSEMGLDEITIMAGILQPIIRNMACNYREREIETTLNQGLNNISISQINPNTEPALVKLFGTSCIGLAKAYAHLPDLNAPSTDYSAQQAENQILLLTVLTEDYRCLYIRIAERLHTIRVLTGLPVHEIGKRKYAAEVLNVYAPLAHRMNLLKFKNELEDRSFEILHPTLFNAVNSVRAASTQAMEELKLKIQTKLINDSVLNDHHATFQVTSRIKSYYQIFLKQIRKGYHHPQQVQDVLGLRVIIIYPRTKKETIEDYHVRGNMLCYYVADQLSQLDHWYVLKDSRKDYLLACKSNGYASLHQYITPALAHLPECKKSQGQRDDNVSNVELQIRTKQMHVAAEIGEAAHWYYKDLLYRPEVARSRYYRMAWRSVEQLRAKSHAHLFGCAKSQLISSRVLVLLDNLSTVINLKKGCTALDAAFAGHLILALTTTEVKLNGVVVPFITTLRNGDVVEIKTTDDGHFTAEQTWLGMVKSPYAISTLKHHFDNAVMEKMNVVELDEREKILN